MLRVGARTLDMRIRATRELLRIRTTVGAVRVLRQIRILLRIRTTVGAVRVLRQIRETVGAVQGMPPKGILAMVGAMTRTEGIIT